MVVPLLLALAALGLGQAAPPASTWSIQLDPATAYAASVHWTVSLSANYCGGFAIGDGVHLQPEDPLKFPDPVPSDTVLFDGLSADADLQNGVLRVLPGPNRLWSQVCMGGDRPFSVELLSSLGMINPDPGTYTVNVWIGTGPATQIPVLVDDQTSSSE